LGGIVVKWAQTIQKEIVPLKRSDERGQVKGKEKAREGNWWGGKRPRARMPPTGGVYKVEKDDPSTSKREKEIGEMWDTSIGKSLFPQRFGACRSIVVDPWRAGGKSIPKGKGTA